MVNTFLLQSFENKGQWKMNNIYMKQTTMRHAANSKKTKKQLGGFVLK